MVGHLTPYDPSVQQFMKTTAGALSRYSDPVVAQRQAYALLEGRLMEQAGLWAYVDTFRFLVLLCARVSRWCSCSRKVRRGGPIAVH